MRRSFSRIPRSFGAILLITLAMSHGCDSSSGRDQEEKELKTQRLIEARLVYRQNEPEKALILVEDVVRTFTDYADAYVLKAKILYELDLKDKAVEAVDRAIELDTASADGYLDLGICLKTLDRHQEAGQSIDKAYELFSRRLEAKSWDVETKLNLALIAHLRGNTQSALDQVRLILASDSQSKAARKLKRTLEEELRANQAPLMAR